MLKKLLKNRKGADIVEYSLLVAGIALICAASIATFGHKTNDMIGTMAAVMPGAHVDDNNPIGSGRIIEAGPQGGVANKPITLDLVKITANSDGTKSRLGDNLGAPAGTLQTLVVEVP